jgi:hypothetical protein
MRSTTPRQHRLRSQKQSNNGMNTRIANAAMLPLVDYHKRFARGETA